MGYMDSCVITRASTKGNFVDGDFVPSTNDVVVYEGPCDIQDRPRSVGRMADGTPEVTFDAKMFFPMSAVPKVIGGNSSERVKLNDVVEVNPRIGPTRKGRVQDIRLLDFSISLRWAKEVSDA